MQYDTDCYLLNGGYEHKIEITKNSANKAEGTYTVEGLWAQPTYPFSYVSGTGNADAKYFGIWVASGTGTATLTNVTCVDKDGNDLGLQTNSANCIITGGKEEPQDVTYTNLSFRDYRKSGDGSDLGTIADPDAILAQTNSVATLDKVRFTGKLKFTETGVRAQEFRIGGNYDNEDQTQYGISIYLNDGTLCAWNWYTLQYQSLGTGFSVNEEIQISMEFSLKAEQSWEVACYVKDRYVTTLRYSQSSNFGNYMHIASGITFVSAGELNAVKEQGPVSYNLQDSGVADTEDTGTYQGYLLTGDCTVTDAGGNPVTVDAENPTLTKPGDYVVLTTAGSFQYSRKVSLYLPGDVDLDGTAGQAADLAKLEELLGGVTASYKADCAEGYAADLDNDGKVGRKDLKLMQDILDPSTETTLESVLEKYHVDALSFDYLGGDEVMPIIGYYGPYSKTQDYINDDIFKKVKDSGINLINYSFNAIGEGNSAAAIKALALAEKYGIGYFVDDFNLNPEYNAATGEANNAPSYLAKGQLAGLLDEYAYFESFLGTHVADEPSPNGSTAVPNRQLKYFDWTAKTLNQFVNTIGFLNVYGENGKGFFDNAGTTYSAFCDAIANDTDAKVLSFDDYPFAATAYGIDMQPTYFKSLWNTRMKAQEHGIPFWGYVQAGGDYEETAHATNPDTQVSEEECYWNVNTMLAFGAKGIEWFPCIQPEFMGRDENGGYDYDRCGLIGIDGSMTPFYVYAQKMNAQIAAIDEVLMKAESTGIMATGTTAKKVLTQSGITLSNSTEKLMKVSAGNAAYGALVGCFDYRDTEAFYVVNYNTAKDTTDSITLTFDGDYDVRFIQDAKSTYSTTSNKALALTIPSGAGVLVVLEDRTVQYTDVDMYRSGESYCVPDAEPGYVFAGWFTDEACTAVSALTSTDTTTQTAYAKFVPEEVLTVKAQLKDVSDDADGLAKTRDIRFLTTVDSLNYSLMGFKVEIAAINQVYDKFSTVVYTEITANEKDGQKIFTPQDWSGVSQYFKTCTVKNVPETLFGADIHATPYWVTLDGTKVYGEGTIKTINMGLALEQ